MPIFQNETSFNILYHKAVKKLNDFEIDLKDAHLALKNSFAHPDQLADAFILLHQQGILNEENIKSMQNYQGMLKHYTKAMILLHQNELLNETNRHIIEADLIIPDIKAQAIIELEEMQLLTHLTQNQLPSSINTLEFFS